MSAQHTFKQTLDDALHSAWVRAIVVIAGIIIAMLPAAVYAYGPSRAIFTTESPADYITFNSITNNASHGDERNFVQIKDAENTSAGGWSDSLDVDDGKEYLVRMLVHNNAAANLNLVATNTRVMANLPTSASTSIQIDGFVSADNASPQRVWDDAVVTNDEPFVVSYVTGSARYYNNVNLTTGFSLSDDIVTGAGALVGYKSMDGNVQGCYQYSGYAIFKIKVEEETTSAFSVDKKVRLQGSESWSNETITANPGDTVNYQIGYTNTGETTQQNVVVKDQLPSIVTYIEGSTTLKNADHPNGNGMEVESNGVVQGGINIGNYAAGANAYVRFTAVMPENDELPLCGENVLRNTAYVEIDGVGRLDQIDVVVTKTCASGAATTDTPGTLPKTGPAEIVLVLIAVTAMAILGTHFVNRYRALREYEAALDASEHQLLLPEGHVTDASHQTVVKPKKK